MTIPIINKGGVSERAIQEARAAVDALPVYVRQELERQEWKLAFFRRKEDSRLISGGLNTGYLDPINKHVGCVEFDDGKRNSIRDTVAHEAGHFVDLCLFGSGESNHGWSSSRPTFHKAAESDIRQLKNNQFREVHQAIASAHHSRPDAAYCKMVFHAWLINNPLREREIYAEIFSNILGQSTLKFPVAPLFPRCAEIVTADHTHALERSNPKPAKPPVTIMCPRAPLLQ